MDLASKLDAAHISAQLKSFASNSRILARWNAKVASRVCAAVGVIMVCWFLTEYSRFGYQHSKWRAEPNEAHHSGPKARYLSPADLMARPLAPAQRSVPKLLHQKWDTKELPAKFEEWSDGCREKHPDWEWVLWTNEDNAMMIEKFLPWLQTPFDSLTNIKKADFVRSAYMMLFGGVYADLDLECLRPMDPIFDEYNVTTIPHLEAVEIGHGRKHRGPLDRRAFFGQMGTDPDFAHSIPNDWMASPPAHPFFFLMLEWTRRRIVDGSDAPPEYVTGPQVLHEGVAEYAKEFWHQDNYGDGFPMSKYETDITHIDLALPHEVVLLPFYYIHPYSWARDGDAFRDVCWSTLETFNATRCKGLVAVDRWPSTTIAYWSHTWNDDKDEGHNKGNLDAVSKPTSPQPNSDKGEHA